jgi:hypothetical protein
LEGQEFKVIFGNKVNLRAAGLCETPIKQNSKETSNSNTRQRKKERERERQRQTEREREREREKTWQCWCTPLIPALGRQRQEDF